MGEVPARFVVSKEGANLLRAAPLHTINGNLPSIYELAARLGLTRLPSGCWRPSQGLEFAATDASIIFLPCRSSRLEELGQVWRGRGGQGRKERGKGYVGEGERGREKSRAGVKRWAADGACVRVGGRWMCMCVCVCLCACV